MQRRTLLAAGMAGAALLNHVQFENRSSSWVEMDRDDRRLPKGPDYGFQTGRGLARPALVRARSESTLRFVPYADLALLDPAVSAFVTRNHVLMVYDTLFAMDEAGVAQHQMLAGQSTEPDGLT